ncbi:class F sortase [Propionicicella superfundia]|uniref:class F sortase n=1 Tax=Propionicicella superfundia TaxID=348582 RepID=UPI0003F7C792|nr:class F sortase [Propionicicella superfundia]
MTASARTGGGSRRRRRLIDAAIGAIIVVLVAAGGWLTFRAFVPESQDAPVPVPFTADPGPVVGTSDPDGTTSRPAELGAGRLLIPSLGVEAPLTPGAVIGSGTGRELTIPADPSRVTVYDEGADVCAGAGTVLVAGHVSSKGVYGALWPLSDIGPNAAVFMTCGDGTLTAWKVEAVRLTTKAELPQDIFTDSGPLRAVIVTCGGPVIDGRYRDNVIVELTPTEWPT